MPTNLSAQPATRASAIARTRKNILWFKSKGYPWFVRLEERTLAILEGRETFVREVRA